MTSVKESQSRNDRCPKVVTEDGSVIARRALHPLKASFPMLDTTAPSENVTVVKEVHDLNAFHMIFATPLPIVTVFKAVHPSKTDNQGLRSQNQDCKARQRLAIVEHLRMH